MPPEEVVVEVAAPVVETPAATVETVEEVKTPTLAETEKLYRENYDKERGRDITKLFPSAVKAPVKVDETHKVEDKTEVVDPAVKVETPEPERKILPKSGAGRTKLKLALAREKNKELEDRIKALENPVKPVEKTTTVKEEAPVEPSRESFETDTAYLLALRKYDKEVAELEKKTATVRATTEQQQQEATAKYADFSERLQAVKVKHEDWDEVTTTSKVTFNPILEGVLITSDPEILYELAKTPANAKNLNELTETSIIAVGNSDDVTGVLRFFSTNLAAVKELNALNAVKAQKYIGKVEERIEKKTVDTPVKKVETETSPRTAKGADDKAKPVAAATVVVEAPKQQDRSRPEPPMKLAGQAPPTSDWTDPSEMSLVEREQRMRESNMFGRRR